MDNSESLRDLIVATEPLLIFSGKQLSLSGYLDFEPYPNTSGWKEHGVGVVTIACGKNEPVAIKNV
ncbi:hypothetical protein [Parabacteroides bouchesdurhonensis]|uniref:hypothetical protein n=1 Tax=Parabacteroides bouchesdurhonensis TaxID=1936995 RepID=UPI000E51914B|nr:hypothetical protein [Parabacteroides bouchesdurhonensis]RHJ90514.1 hypothetical protein DW095_12780 [Bacteroides sp. AM07-16]